MSKKSRTKKATMTRSIAGKIVETWTKSNYKIDRSIFSNLQETISLNFNTDVSNNKRKVKIRIHLVEG